MLWQDELTNCCRIYVLLHTLLQDFSPSQDGSSEENREASRRSDAGYALFNGFSNEALRLWGVFLL